MTNIDTCDYISLASKAFNGRIIQTKRGFELWERHPNEDCLGIYTTMSQAYKAALKEKQEREAKLETP